MTASIPDSHSDLLYTRVHGVLTTMMPDTSPQSSVVWVDYDGEYVLIDKISYLLHSPERGDVVVFTPPNNDRDYIKRVIGLPGDTVEIKGGRVYVNGIVLDEPYLRNVIHNDMPPRVVEEGRYFVLGDNRNNSSDSRAFGSITPQSIVGRAWLVYWPPSDWSTVPHHSYAAVPTP